MRSLRSSRSAVRSCTGALGTALLLAAAPARADDSAAADALFQAAKLLVAEGKYAEACPKFEASFKLDRTLGTLLNLADCHEKEGKIASSWAEWGEAAELAAKAGDKREEFAKEHRAALTDRLPKLEIKVQNPREGLSVRRDDIAIDPAMFGLALPVDPGKHVIVVRRGDQVLKEEPIDLAERQSATVSLDLAAIDRAVPPVQSPRGGDRPAPQAAPSGTQKTVGLVVGGVGAAAVIAAAVLEVVALTKKGDADDPTNCVSKYCAPSGLEAVDGAKTFADVGQWIGIGGIVALAVGATLVITAPSSPSASPSARAWVAPFVAPSGGGIGVGGRL